MNRRLPWASLAALCLACAAPHDDLPEIDIFMAPVIVAGDTITIGAPERLTDHRGYDNQPAFRPDGSGLYYVSRDEGHSDIHFYDLSTRSSRQLTSTRMENEYSPRLSPDGESISTVRVERGGGFRLLRLDLDGGNPRPVTDRVHESISYYAWIDAGSLVVVVTAVEPNELYLVDLQNGDVRLITTDVGRSVQAIPGRRSISFQHHPESTRPWINELDVDTGEILRIAPALPGSVDHAWIHGDLLIATRGSELFALVPGPASRWEAVVDFRSQGLNGLTRVSVSADASRIAFAAE